MFLFKTESKVTLQVGGSVTPAKPAMWSKVTLQVGGTVTPATVTPAMVTWAKPTMWSKSWSHLRSPCLRNRGGKSRDLSSASSWTMIPQPSRHNETNNQSPTPDTCTQVHLQAMMCTDVLGGTPQGHNVWCLSSLPVSFYASLLGWLPISILENKTSATNIALCWVLCIILENYRKLGSMGSLNLWSNSQKKRWGHPPTSSWCLQWGQSVCPSSKSHRTPGLDGERPLLYSLLHLPGFWQTLVTEEVIKCNNYPCSWLSDKYLQYCNPKIIKCVFLAK